MLELLLLQRRILVKENILLPGITTSIMIDTKKATVAMNEVSGDWKNWVRDYRRRTG